MGSSYFGEPNMGNERSGSSSRRGKKSIHPDKPKQPQRGLGVAQLEKIRLHGQNGSSYNSSLQPSFPANLNQDDLSIQTGYSPLPTQSSFPYSSSSSPSYGFQPSSASYGFQPSSATYGFQSSSATYGFQPSSATYGVQPSSASYGFQPNVKMNFGEMERPTIRYGDSQPSTITRWNSNNDITDPHLFAQPNMTRPLLNMREEDSILQKRRKKDRCDSFGSSSPNSESSDTQEVDLELKLAL